MRENIKLQRERERNPFLGEQLGGLGWGWGLSLFKCLAFLSSCLLTG